MMTRELREARIGEAIRQLGSGREQYERAVNEIADHPMTTLFYGSFSVAISRDRARDSREFFLSPGGDGWENISVSPAEHEDPVQKFARWLAERCGFVVLNIHGGNVAEEPVKFARQNATQTIDKVAEPEPLSDTQISTMRIMPSTVTHDASETVTSSSEQRDLEFFSQNLRALVGTALADLCKQYGVKNVSVFVDGKEIPLDADPSIPADQINSDRRI